MTQVHIFLEPEVVSFYSRLAKTVGLPLERVLSDALFKLAGELSLLAHIGEPLGKVYLHIGDFCNFLFFSHSKLPLSRVFSYLIL